MIWFKMRAWQQHYIIVYYIVTCHPVHDMMVGKLDSNTISYGPLISWSTLYLTTYSVAVKVSLLTRTQILITTNSFMLSSQKQTSDKVAKMINGNFPYVNSKCSQDVLLGLEDQHLECQMNHLLQIARLLSCVLIG